MIIYCSKNAIGLNNGIDWQNAYLELDDAINYAISDEYVDEIKVDYDTFTISGNKIINPSGILKITSTYNTSQISNNMMSYTIINFNQITSNTLLEINNCELHSNTGFSILSSGTLRLINSNYYGTNFGTISNDLQINNSNIILTNPLILSDCSTTITNSNISADTIFTINNSDISLAKSTLQSMQYILTDNTSIESDIKCYDSVITGNITTNSNTILEFNNCTINGVIDSLSDIVINNSICSTSGCLTNNTLNNLIATNSALYNVTLSGNLKLTKEPYYRDVNNNDYTVMFGVGEKFTTFELTSYNAAIQQNVQAQKFTNITIDEQQFMYIVNNIFVFSDYTKEMMFADLVDIKSVPVLNYSVSYKKEHVINDIPVVSAFPMKDVITSSGVEAAVVNIWPYEWDIFSYDDYSVDGYKDYIVPRTLIDITDVLRNQFFSNIASINLENLEVITIKENINNGVAFDYNSSTINKRVVWILDQDQNLKKFDMYSNTDIDRYNLLSISIPDASYFIKPSGLIPFGQTVNGYKYQLENNPNIIIEGVNDQYQFEWMPTDRGNTYMFTGMVCYKDNIYLTGKYTIDNKSIIASYPIKGTYLDYITNEPNVMFIGNDDQLFTDITVLEDGSFLLSSKNTNKLFRYIPKYDYANIVSSNTDDTTIILRENYDNITL